MPTYEYQCTVEGNRFELWQEVGAQAPPCPECGAPSKKVFGVPRVIFKGSGFYLTDMRAEQGKGGSAKGGSDKGSAESGSSSASETASSTATPSSDTSSSSASSEAKPSASSAPSTSTPPSTTTSS